MSRAVMSEPSRLSVAPDWQNILATGIPGTNLHDTALKCQLIFTLLVFLNLSLRDLIFFFLESTIPEVKQTAGLFLAHKPSWAIPFAPAHVYAAWHDRFPKSRPHLHAMLSSCAKEIVLEESDRIINAPELKMKPKECTIKFIRSMLNPGKFSSIYERLAPFTWSVARCDICHGVCDFGHLRQSPSLYRHSTNFMHNNTLGGHSLYLRQGIYVIGSKYNYHLHLQ